MMPTSTAPGARPPPPAITVNHPSLERRLADYHAAMQAGLVPPPVTDGPSVPPCLPLTLHDADGSDAALYAGVPPAAGGAAYLAPPAPLFAPSDATSPPVGATAIMGPPSYSPRRASTSRNNSTSPYARPATSPYARPVTSPHAGAVSPSLAAAAVLSAAAAASHASAAATARPGTTSLKRQAKPLPKKYICDHPGCGKAFDRPYNLKTHYRTHTNERPYACDRCDKSFSRAHDLKRHMMAIHDNNKPFKCYRCDHRFARVDALQRHVRSDANCDVMYRAAGIDPLLQPASPTALANAANAAANAAALRSRVGVPRRRGEWRTGPRRRPARRGHP
ncbi:hypothetical protein AMAG_09257 [Allomyces macrogynus ATCC 38327]|uniref:C2H2-type domain-containing protein n=1 Tax=Allomyces macrogynus (strain ATCC 38327) TaxID=578462 RepID=A0A0L0SP98_ALLM3|nr:hypothetical protein AMAG_09257 [Allomyces macrogynus ATCC 38327]|eukprot:KNE64214.1 hypothetical protein AMAG_09257 [Allomyces macrogynus ATCC 38327]